MNVQNKQTRNIHLSIYKYIYIKTKYVLLPPTTVTGLFGAAAAGTKRLPSGGRDRFQCHYHPCWLRHYRWWLQAPSLLLLLIYEASRSLMTLVVEIMLIVTGVKGEKVKIRSSAVISISRTCCECAQLMPNYLMILNLCDTTFRTAPVLSAFPKTFNFVFHLRSNFSEWNQ